MDSPLIPVCEPDIGERELEYVTRALRSGWITGGPFVEEFERRWADFCGRKHGIATSSGTTALEAAVATLDLRPGDEVILPTFTMIACAMAVIYNGAKPVLVDSDPRTWCMDPEEVAGRITTRTRAIMPVHIYGHPVDMDPILDLARRYGLAVIEDVAEAHGAEYLRHHGTQKEEWKRCSSLGNMGTFSFYGNKIITTGEGGMVVTDDDEAATRLRSLRNMCFGKEHRFAHQDLGFNFRMTDLQAAVGVAQTEKASSVISRKRQIASFYTECLKDLEGIQLPAEEPWAKNVYWVYGIVLSGENGTNAIEFAERLRKRGVDTRPFFLGMHEQPVFHRQGLFRDERYPIAEHLAHQGLYLPSGVKLKDSDIDRVSNAVRQALAESS